MPIAFPTYHSTRRLFFLWFSLFLALNLSAQDSLTFIKPPFTVAAGKPQLVKIDKIVIEKAVEKQNFIQYSLKDGLPHNTVTIIMQDSRGYLWITTGAGVSVFDGIEFKAPKDLPDGFDTRYVSQIIQDSNGNIWLGNDFGNLFKYSHKGWEKFNFGQPGQNNYVMDMIEDNKGHIWLTTNDGIFQFNGHYFNHYTEKDGLVGQSFSEIFKDKAGKLYFYKSLSGTSTYDGNTFSNLFSDDSLNDTYINKIFEDTKGGLWFGGYELGLRKKDSIGFTDYSNEDGLGDDVTDINEDDEGNIWIATGGDGTSKYDGNLFTNYRTKDGLCSNSILNIYKEKQGNLWFSNQAGRLCRYNGISFEKLKVHEGKLLPEWQMPSIYEDRANNLWFRTNIGLSKLLRSPFTFLNTEDNSLNNQSRIYHDSKGNLWATARNKIIHKFDGEYITKYTLPNNIFSVFEDSKGNLWFGGFSDVFKFDGSNFYKYSSDNGFGHIIKSIEEDKDGMLWFGGFDGITKFDGKHFTRYLAPKSEESSISFWDLLKRRNGNFWFIWQKDGDFPYLSIYNGQKLNHYDISDHVIGKEPYSLLEDQQGNVWIGTDNGIQVVKKSKIDHWLLAKDSSAYIQIKTKRGIEWNLNPIAQDLQGNVWVGSLAGLFRISNIEKGVNHPDSMVIERMSEGLNHSSFRKMSVDQNGKIWIPTETSLIKYDPELDRPNSLEPLANISSVDLDLENTIWWRKDQEILKGVRFDSLNKSTYLPENLKLPYFKNQITFSFIGISLRHPKQVRYQWKLEGSDKNWSPVTDKREITYSNLSSGKYTFKVKARNEDRIWNEKPVTFSFEILPPWWETWWARSLYVIFGLAAIFGYIRWRTAALKKRQKELEQTVTERTAEVVAQKEVILKEKERSEELLLNILPAETAEELKQYGSAKAKNYDTVTVLFTDFKSFTMHSERLSPEELVAEIDHCFKEFDLIMDKYNVEKIKTIGDAYMAAAGLPTPNTSNPEDAVHAAWRFATSCCNTNLNGKPEKRIAF